MRRAEDLSDFVGQPRLKQSLNLALLPVKTQRASRSRPPLAHQD